MGVLTKFNYVTICKDQVPTHTLLLSDKSWEFLSSKVTPAKNCDPTAKIPAKNSKLLLLFLLHVWMVVSSEIDSG